MDTLSTVGPLDYLKLRRFAHLINNDSQVYSTQTSDALDTLTNNNVLPWQLEKNISRCQAEAESNANITVIDACKLI